MADDHLDLTQDWAVRRKDIARRNRKAFVERIRAGQGRPVTERCHGE